MGRNRDTRSRYSLARGARMCILPFVHLFFSQLVLFYYDKLSRCVTILSEGYREEGRQTEKRRESRLPARAFRQIEFAGAEASG